MSLSLLLALRFLRSSGLDNNIATMIKICFTSILLGTAALTLVAAIMNGFEKETHKKLQGVHADITINSHDKALNYEKLKKVLSSEYSDTIAAFGPTSFAQVIIQNKTLENNEMQICLLKAIDPKAEPQVSSIKEMICDTAVNPWSALNRDTLFIGQSLADRLQIKTGSRVTILYHQEEVMSNKITLEEKEVTIVALFKTGIHDFDEHVLIGSFDLLKQLYPIKITQVTIKLKDTKDEKTVISSLKNRLALNVYSWKDLYPPLVSALTLERYAMFFILALVTLVASLNIISLLFMYATQKQHDIALLKTMGMTDAALISIFVFVSGAITLTATFCGILIAALATWLLNTFPFIELPDVYYVSHLPATLDFRIIVSVFLLALVVCLFAALIPAQKIKSMHVASVLKGLPA